MLTAGWSNHWARFPLEVRRAYFETSVNTMHCFFVFNMANFLPFILGPSPQPSPSNSISGLGRRQSDASTGAPPSLCKLHPPAVLPRRKPSPFSLTSRGTAGCSAALTALGVRERPHFVCTDPDTYEYSVFISKWSVNISIFKLVTTNVIKC